MAPERLSNIVDYTLDHFDQKTKRSSTYRIKDKRLSGFNSIFATASIEAAKRYYNIFKLAQQERLEADPGYQVLKIGLIYSFAVNEDETDGFLAEEEFETEDLDWNSREFLEHAIQDYNEMFQTNFDTTSDKFQNYYKDFSQRLKTRELDLAIVVNMFLTGFDATTLNTLWVDKNLRQHGLLQAYSRTNRILNSVKTFGNIVTFRDLEDATKDALSLFGNKEAHGVVLLRPYGEYLEEYEAKVAELTQTFVIGEQIVGEENQKHFIATFGSILRLRNILTAFDEFADDDLLSERQLQDYQSIYLNLWQEFRSRDNADKESIVDAVTFEIELVKQVEINVDYILRQVQQYLDTFGTGRDKEIQVDIARAIDSSPSLRNKKDLVEQFVESLSVDANVDEDWRAFISNRREEELDQIIAEEGLDPALTKALVENALRDGVVPSVGPAINEVLPPTSRFSPDGAHSIKKSTVIERLRLFLDRFFGL